MLRPPPPLSVAECRPRPNDYSAHPADAPLSVARVCRRRMAANLDWAMRTLFGDERVVVWAHDLHVSHGGDRERSFNGGAQMGAHLRHTYRHSHRAFSLLNREGAYSATRSFSDHTILAVDAFPGPTGSVEHLLASVPRAPGSRDGYGEVPRAETHRTDSFATEG